jgi:hypothetical protein
MLELVALVGLVMARVAKLGVGEAIWEMYDPFPPAY